MSDSSGYMTINGSHNVTNTLSDAAFYTHVIDTCEQIRAVLADHCGPYATDAMIIQANDGRNLKDPTYAIFTKDGINIVRSIEFVSPIQRQIQNLVAYVGSRVDDRSHDGTTTAMLFFISLVMHFFSRRRQALADGVLLNHRQLRRDLTQTLALLSESLEAAVVTVERFAEDFDLSRTAAIRYIAHHQAMLSSKNDVELADAIVEVVETLPPELYGLFSVSQSKLEMDQRFTVVRDTFDFVMNVISNLDDMNHRMGTEYLSESCDLIVSEDDLVRGNPALVVVESHVALAKQGELSRDLVILTKSIDATLLGAIALYNRMNAHKIVVFTYSTHSPYSSRVTLLSAVSAVASIHSLGEHMVDPSLPYLIGNVHVHYKGKRLYLSNLYDKDGSAYHPSFTDPERFLPYTRLIGDIREIVDTFTSGRRRVGSAADAAMFEDYVDIYRRMISADVRTLQISGMRHDTLADRDVLQDAFGAVLSSLEHGFVVDGYLKLYMALARVENKSVATRAVGAVIRGVLETVHKGDAASAPPARAPLPHPGSSDSDSLKNCDVISDSLKNCDVISDRLKKRDVISDRLKKSLVDFDRLPAGSDGTGSADPLDNWSVIPRAEHHPEMPHCVADPETGRKTSAGGDPEPTWFDVRLQSVFELRGKAQPLYLYYPADADPTDALAVTAIIGGGAISPVTPVIQPADSYRELFRRVEDLLLKLLNTNRAIIPGTVNTGHGVAGSAGTRTIS